MATAKAGSLSDCTCIMCVRRSCSSKESNNNVKPLSDIHALQSSKLAWPKLREELDARGQRQKKRTLIHVSLGASRL